MKTSLRLMLAALLSAPVMAHHAEALFDRSRTQSINGTVTEYLWANPHTNIYLEVTGADGRSSVAVFEGGSANAMRRAGWSRATLAIGDKVALSFYPRRDVRPGGQLIAATLADGRVLHWQASGAP